MTKNLVPRVIGYIKFDKYNHPYAVLETAFDENGAAWKAGTPFYDLVEPYKAQSVQKEVVVTSFGPGERTAFKRGHIAPGE